MGLTNDERSSLVELRLEKAKRFGRPSLGSESLRLGHAELLGVWIV